MFGLFSFFNKSLFCTAILTGHRNSSTDMENEIEKHNHLWNRKHLMASYTDRQKLF